jgi:hypothetical protein
LQYGSPQPSEYVLPFRANLFLQFLARFRYFRELVDVIGMKLFPTGRPLKRLVSWYGNQVDADCQHYQE